MQVKVELFGLMRAKLGQDSLTLTLENRSGPRGVTLREILYQLEKTFVDQKLRLLEGEEIRPGVLLIRKLPPSGRAEMILHPQDAWVQDQEVIILASLVAGG